MKWRGQDARANGAPEPAPLDHRAPLAVRLMGDWLYVDRAGREGVGGWIAPRSGFDYDHVEITTGGVMLSARLAEDPAHVDGRVFRRFECALPLSDVNLMTLRFGGAARSLITISRGQARGPLFFPSPLKARRRSPSVRRFGRTLIVLAPIDWSFRRQRSQQLTKALSVHYDTTLYLGPSNLQLAGDTFATEGIELPLLGTAPDSDFSRRNLTPDEASATATALLALAGARPDVMVQFPGWRTVASRLAGARVIYDCIDDHAALPHVCAEVDKDEKVLVREAALCLATSGSLLEHVKALGAQQSLLVPNAGPSPLPGLQLRRRADRVIYVGAIESWFDFDLLQAAAHCLPEADFEIVGRIGAALPPRLAPNIRFVGERSFDYAMHAMRRARVGIIPFKRERLIQAVNPVKAYEYLAAGLPIVMTPMGGVEFERAPGVYVADTNERFAAALRQAYGLSEQERARCVEWARGHTWEARAEAILKQIGF